MLKNIELYAFCIQIFVRKYESYLKEMVPHNYKQLAVFENEICIAVTGFWTGTKLWSGKYIEIDNFIVHPEHRSKGLGKMMTDYIDVKAKENCSMIVLDALQEILLRIVFITIKGMAQKAFIL
jgi:ribosomal protein S18 acetylase RimI-like enzyme